MVSGRKSLSLTLVLHNKAVSLFHGLGKHSFELAIEVNLVAS